MNINCSSVSFRGDLVYKDRYIPSKQDVTHDVIRAHFEEQLGPYFYYIDQIAKEKQVMHLKPQKKNSDDYWKESCYTHKENNHKVDFSKLQKLGLPALRERRQNELYSGFQLHCVPEELDSVKKAGIKSVFGLVPYYEKDVVEKSGLVYKDLATVSSTPLSVFDINGDLIQNLIKHPEIYANGNSDEKTESLKMFVKTLNGDNPDVPLPIYFGCHNGTDRTFLWYHLYTILKDEDMDKPLSQEKVRELAEFTCDLADYFRW